MDSQIIDSTTSSRRWCLTINNPSGTCAVDIKAIFENKSNKISYLVYGNEIGSISGVPHFQMYISFNNSVRFSAVKKLFPEAHIEQAYGTAEQNIDYCTKDKDFIEFGTRPSTGVFKFLSRSWYMSVHDSV